MDMISEETTLAETSAESDIPKNTEQTIVVDGLEYRLANNDEILGGWIDGENEFLHIFGNNHMCRVAEEYVEVLYKETE